MSPKVQAFRRHFDRSYRLVRQLNFVLALIAALFILAIMANTLFEVVMRYGFRSPTIWTLQVSSYLLLYVIYVATAYTLQQDGHVRIEFVVERLSPRVRKIVQGMAGVLGLSFCMVFLWQSVRLTVRAFVEHQRDLSLLNVPLATTTIILPIGLFILVITYIFKITETFLELLAAPPKE